MRAGKLRHRITIQERVETQDDYGSSVAAWVTFATVHASVEPISGKELLAAQAINSETRVRMRLRYISGITSDMRVSFNLKLYNIQEIIDFKEENRELQLMCNEGVNDG